MEYLVMECHLSYAVVMDHEGRFQKVANLGYQVGQEVDSVLPMNEPKPVSPMAKWTPALSMAACLCIVFTGLWQMVLLSIGTVLIQINPQIRLNVNRMERVISAEAVNPDGAKVLFDYHPFGKTVEQVTEELTDRAAAMGYLTDGGEVHLTVDSQNAEWKTKTEARLESVTVHDAKDVVIIIEHLEEILPDDDDWDEDDLDDDDDIDDRDDDDDPDDQPEPDDDHHDDDDDDDDPDEDDDDDDDDPDEDDDEDDDD